MDATQHSSIVSFIWGILEPTKQAVLEMKKTLDKARITDQDQPLRHAAGQAFYTSSKFTLRDLRNRASQQKLKADFGAYLDGFSPNVQEILDNFEFRNQIPRLTKADALDHPRYLRRGRRPSSSGFGEAFASTGAERTWVLEHRSAAETEPKPEIGGRPGPLRYRRCALGTLIEKFLNPRVHLSPYPVQNGSGSLEDETRDQAWLEAIVALPLNMFYSTGIATYVWLLSNGKPEHRRGKVQPIDATKWFKPLRKNLGKKNCELSEEDIQPITEVVLAFDETEDSRIFDNRDFGYWKVTVERPLRLRVDLSKKKRAGFQMVCADAGDDDHANLIEVAAKRLGIGPHDDCNAFVEELLHARTRLSADAVTGQVDVRQAAANLPDELDAEEPDIAEVDEMADAEDELPDAEAAE